MAGEPRTIPTSCVLDCPDTCSLDVTVQDDAIVSIGAGDGNPLTAGFICSKVRRFGRRVEHEARLLHPLRRTGAKGSGTFERISWDDALSEIVARFASIRDEHGGESILPYHYGGSNGFLSDELVDHAFFARLGASRLGKTICAAPTSAVAAGMYGKMPGVAFRDYAEAKVILIWGANPRASNIHLVPHLHEAKRRGAFIAAIDPVRQLSSDLVDLHLPVFPGADLPLALGMIHHWNETDALDRELLSSRASGLDRLLAAARDWPLEDAARAARVDPGSVRELCDRMAASSPTVVRCGWGLERNRNGGHAVAAVLAMPALLGKFGVRGGGYTLSNSGAGYLKASSIWDRSGWNTRTVNMSELARVLNESELGDGPPIHGLFVYNCNPVATVPDQRGIERGLAREDLFTVVFEQVMTDTACFADIVLPATTFLEHHDIKRSYGNYVVAATQPVIEARGEARPNAAVFQELGRRFGFEDDVFAWSEEELRSRVIDAIRAGGEPVDPEPLHRGRAHVYEDAFEGSTPVQLDSVSPTTPDGRIDLAPSCLGDEPYRYRPIVDERYPLALVTPATGKTVTSTLGEFNLESLTLTIHPDDAAPRGVASGDAVRVVNGLGEVHCRARVDEVVAPGVVHLPKGAWRKSSLNGAVSTALTPAHVNEVAGGACFNDARVEVELLD